MLPRHKNRFTRQARKAGFRQAEVARACGMPRLACRPPEQARACRRCLALSGGAVETQRKNAQRHIYSIFSEID